MLAIFAQRLTEPLDSVGEIYIPRPPGVLGIWGEGLLIFMELGSTGNYFRDLGIKLKVLWI